MNYSKIQKLLSSFLLFIFFFGQIFGLSFFSLLSNSVYANNSEFYDLVSIVVTEDVYNKLDDEIEKYSEDIQGYLDNTKVVILPIKNNTNAFSIASMNESMFYEGYKGLKSGVLFESKLIGTVIIGNVDLPIVENNGKIIKSIAPFVDFEDKNFIYNHKTKLFEKNNENLDGFKAEIFHGIISPNSGDKQKNIKLIKDFLDKDHDFYSGKNLFNENKGVINGKNGEEINKNYKPYVFYFDSIREQKSLNYSAYKGYESYINNREDINYDRYSVELAEKVKKEVLGAQNKELESIIGKIDDNKIKNAFSNFRGPDLGKISDISTKNIIEGTTNNLLEIFNKGSISDFRTNVHNAGRYNTGNSKVNVDLVPYFISVLDLVSDKVVKSANTDLEKQIDDLVINDLSKNIKIPEKIGNNENNLICGRLEYTNYFNGKKASDLKKASDCSIYRGSTLNDGTLVEANRGLNVYLTEDDAKLCLGKDPKGIYGGSSPLNLDFGKISTDLNFHLKGYNLKKAVKPVFDIKGSKRVFDLTKNPSPKNCLENNFIKTLEDDTLCGGFGFEIYDVLNENSSGSIYRNKWECDSDNEIYTGKLEDIIDYKIIPSYLMHKSPTIDELNKQLESKVVPNLPIDKDRYIDFFSEEVDSVEKTGIDSYKKIIYPNLYRIIGKKKKDIEIKLDILLDEKSKEIRKIGGNIDLKSFLKNKEVKEINIIGEKKKVSYYDFLVFSIYWNNLNNISAKYKFVFENYLSDQVGGNDFDFILAKNKKQYEIAYLGAYGDAKNMYVKIDPESKNVNPYPNIVSQNSLFNSNRLSLGVINSNNQISFNGDGNFKCAPPEGVPIWEWIPAIVCRLGNLLPVDISIGEGTCGSSELFASEDEYSELINQQGVCTNDSNKNGINDCVENRLKNNGKLKLSSDKSKYFFNKRGTLKTEILDKKGKRIMLDNSSYVNFDLKKIIDKKTGKTVYDNTKDDFNKSLNIINKYVFFKPYSIRSSYGTTNYSFTTKNNEADIYFESKLELISNYSTINSLNLGGNKIGIEENNNKNIDKKVVSIKSKPVVIKIRNERLFLNFYSFKNGIGNTLKSVKADDKINIYLFSGKNKDIKNFNRKNNSLVFELLNIGEGNNIRNISFPIEISLKNKYNKLIQKEQIKSLNNFKELYTIQKSGTYFIDIKDKYGYKIKSQFEVIASEPKELKIDLGSSILEKKGAISSNLVSIYDRFKNIVSGDIYDFDLNILGDSVIFEQTNNKKLNSTTFEGYRAFRLKSLNKNGISKLKIDLFKDDKKILSNSKNIKVIDIFNINIKYNNILKVGNNSYEAKLNFVDKNNKLLNDLNSRVYISNSGNYLEFENSYFEVINGKALVKFKTKTLAGENIALNFRVEGFKNNVYKYINILPERPMNLSLVASKTKLEASKNSETYIKVELKDVYNNTVFNDNTSNISLEILDKYRTIIHSNNFLNKLNKGKTTFKISATDLPGIAYLKFKINKNLEENEFIVGEGEKSIKIKGVSENVISLETFYFYNKNKIIGNKYNALYTTLLGAEYGDITQKDYLAGSMIFDENNRSLAVTSLLSNPYNVSEALNIFGNGKISKVYDSSDLTQDITIKLNKNSNNTYYLDLFNSALNIYIGKIYLNFDNLNISNEDYKKIENNKSFDLKEILNISDYEIYSASNKIKLNNLIRTKKNSLILFLESSDYNIKDLYSKNGKNVSIYYKDPFATKNSLNTFAGTSFDSYENFTKNKKVGWGGANKTLLSFSAGESVGDSTKDYMGLLNINIGDPIVSLKKIKKKSYGITKKFDSTIGKKLNKKEILTYKVFDYNSDSRDDILLIEKAGFFSLLENTKTSSKFLNQKNLARIVDLGNIDLINTGDFSGDKYEDIFFVNNKGNPFLLNNKTKDFTRIDLTKIFNLKGKIIQAKSFDMDNDNIDDIITLDDFGEINIFYGISGNNVDFTKKTIYSGYGIILSKNSRNDLAAIYFDGLPQNTKKINTSKDAKDIVPVSMLENLMFENISYNLDIDSDKQNSTKQTKFIKSEFASQIGLQIKKTYKDINGGKLSSGDIIEVEVNIKNISNKFLKNIVYLEDIPSYFDIDLKSIKTDKEVIIKKGLNKYKFYIDKFNLSKNSELKITYKIKTKALKYGNIKVGLFEKGEVGDDNFGDILLSSTKYNCGGDSDIFRSTAKRNYLKGIKIEKCDSSKIPEELSKNDIDTNSNGIPDYIDELQNDPDKLKEYANNTFNDYNASNKQEEDSNILDKLDELNNNVDEISGEIDEFIQGFGCGFGGGSCFGMPMNWAPLAAGNDPVILGKLVGDGLRVDEGYPVFSALTGINIPTSHGCHQIPSVWPVSPFEYTGRCNTNIQAGGSLGINSVSNYFRLFVTPTLTGGAGIAACYGAPASSVGNTPPKGLNPVVPGGNCIVTAAPLGNLCSDEELNSDPGSIGQVDYFGGDLNGNGEYGIINGNCSAGTGHKKLPGSNMIDTSLARAYLDYKKTGIVSSSLKENFIQAFQNPAKPGVVSYNSSLAGNEPLISLNGGDINNSDVSVSIDFSDESDGIVFKGVEELTQDRVAPFPSFITGWVNDQLEEFITKLTDFPTLFIILPDFSGVFNTDWGDYTDKLVSGTKQTSGIKEAYEFLGNVPFVSIQGEPVNINVPQVDEATLNATLTQWKLAANSYEGELKTASDAWTYGGVCNTDIGSKTGIKCEGENAWREKAILRSNKFLRSLNMNIQTLETYKRIPEQLANLAGKKQDYLEQILCNVEAIGEVTGGWLDRNGKRFKSWVELYILIKAILKSWQLLADIFIDYDEECHECKNERHDSLGAQFELVDMIIPKIPIIKFPKWPDIVLDLHNIRMNLTVVLPEFEFTKRPIVLPPLPKLTLPDSPEASLELPNLPILPQIEIPELPDLPSIPTVKLPDLPPPPKLPKLFSSIKGVLNILKLITKAMCILKKSPFVPESRAGDQIAFLTEGSGYRPFDFIDMTMPQFSYPFVDEIKVTSFVNLEFESEFIVEIAKTIAEPINSVSSDFIHMFDKIKPNDVDLSGASPENIELKLESNVSSNDFLALVNKELSNKELSNKDIIKNPRYKQLRKSFDVVNNYTYSKENKLISDLKQANYEKFDILKSILKKEIKKQKDFKNQINNIGETNKYRKISNNDIYNIKLYNSSLSKYNDSFKKAAKALINPNYLDTKSLKTTGDKIIKNIKNTTDKYDKLVAYKSNEITSKNNLAQKNNYLAAETSSTSSPQVCSAKTSNYKRKYEGLYIIQEEANKKISYKLFDYLDDLSGDEVTTAIDYDLDTDLDLLYSMDNNLYLKENLINNSNINHLSGVEVLDINDNKFINGDIFYEAVNGANESFVANEFINVNFLASSREDISNYRLEYYTIIDKYLNENNSGYLPKNVEKNIVDAFVSSDDDTIINKDNGIIKRKNYSYIYEVGNNISNIILKTKKLLNIKDSLKNGNIATISPNTKIYTGKSSSRINYIIGAEEKLKSIKIDGYMNIEFPETIQVVSISGDAYISSNKDIILKGNEIYNYLDLPILFDTKIEKKQEFITNSSSHIGIKYYDNSKNNLDFRKINSYTIYDLGFKSDNYSISLSVENDYLYSRLQVFKNNIFGTKTSQILLSPQLASDKYAPEIDFNAKIRLPVYQKKIIDLTDAIYENSGFENIANLSISGIENDKFKILKTNNKIRIDFGEFEKIFTKKIVFTITDTNGNTATKDVVLEVYPPIPQITNYENSIVSGVIDEELTGEPINLYRYRGGVIKRLETNSGRTKVDSKTGKFDFNINTIKSNLIDIKLDENNAFTINENTGKINLLNPLYKVKAKINDNNFIEISVLDISGKQVFSESIKLKSSNITITNDFSNLEENGLYLRLTNTDFDYYKIPDSAKINPGSVAIYRKTDTKKEALFAILPDSRIKTLNGFYKIEYSTFNNYIVLKLIDRHFNKEVGQLLLKLDSSYVIK